MACQVYSCDMREAHGSCQSSIEQAIQMKKQDSWADVQVLLPVFVLKVKSDWAGTQKSKALSITTVVLIAACMAMALGSFLLLFPAYPWMTANQLFYSSLRLSGHRLCKHMPWVAQSDQWNAWTSQNIYSEYPGLYQPDCNSPMYHTMLKVLNQVFNIYKFAGYFIAHYDATLMSLQEQQGLQMRRMSWPLSTMSNIIQGMGQCWSALSS